MKITDDNGCIVFDESRLSLIVYSKSSFDESAIIDGVAVTLNYSDSAASEEALSLLEEIISKRDK